MFPGVPTRAEVWLVRGFWITLAVWVGLSVFVLVNRILYDRRAAALRALTDELKGEAVATLPAEERAEVIDRILTRRSRRAVYRLISDQTQPSWVTEVYAAYSLRRWGLPRMVRDAMPGGVGKKWRRIAALFALAQIRADRIHDLLERAVRDPDRDVAGAAVVVLHRLQDRRAASILIAALCDRTYPPSRIATQLDQFSIPIDDLLRPLLHDHRAHARYWATSLLRRYPDLSDLTGQVTKLARDAHAPVRKAALEALDGLKPSTAMPIALSRLVDSVGYVRSKATRSLARLAALDGRPAVGSELAQRIVPLLGDPEWEVRLAAKESLEALGPPVWREVAVALDSTDMFARNGAAEVLQNLGLIDRLIDEVGRGIEPSPEMIAVLERAFREGGPRIVDAAIARSDPDLFPSIENLMSRLTLTGVKVA